MPTPNLTDPQVAAMIRRLVELKKAPEWAPHKFTVKPELDGVPLAVALSSQFALPKSFMKKLVLNHDVRVERDVEGRPEKVKYGESMRVKTGDVVIVTGAVLPERQQPVDWTTIQSKSAEEKHAALTSLIVHEDDRILIINKPTGVSVQPGPGIPYSLDQLVRENMNPELRLVHRLDKDASGILILAKSAEAATELRRRLDEAQTHASIEKIYWAMTIGRPEMAFGEIYSNIYLSGRYPRERMTSHADLRTVLLDKGKAAISQWRHLGTYIKRHKGGRRDKLSLLEMRPITGRKHQLRVHCAEQLELPIVGDAKYGYDKHVIVSVTPRPLHLHCYQVRLHKWSAGNGDERDLTVTAPIPAHFVETMEEYKLFLPKRPKLKKPQVHSNVRKLYDRTIN